MSALNFGLIGFGYWGPNLARNFGAQPDCAVSWICDLSTERQKQAAQSWPAAKTTGRIEDVLDDPDVHAVLIATPVSTHFEIAKRAILAGKHVFIEKPMTHTSAEAQELIELAEKHQRVLAVDHTFLFTGAVRKMKEMLDSGELGELLYFDSVRINLGLFQHDINVLFDLGPHDLSIADHLFPVKPIALRAMGACHCGQQHENLVYLHLEFANGMVAHFHWNWLAPVKIRHTLLCGTKKMIVYDDMAASEKLKVYDKGVVVSQLDQDSLAKFRVDYRVGDMIAPKLDQREALAMEAAHFADCVRTGNQPLADGHAGLRVVRMLEAAQESLRSGGERIVL
jgi:predicted dehydrogenase